MTNYRQAIVERNQVQSQELVQKPVYFYLQSFSMVPNDRLKRS